MSRTHELKCWPEPFEAIRDGLKRFEYRRDDRGFAVGDVLLLHKWKPDDSFYGGYYTGSETKCVVTYILAGCFGVPDGFVVMSIERWR